MGSVILSSIAILCFTLVYGSNGGSPHILVLFMDDLGYADVSYKGAEYSTPTIDALAQKGIDFTRYYVHPTCTPTRAALMSGRYAWKTGLQSMYTIPPAATAHLPLEFATLPQSLKDAGYETHMFGKWHLGYAAWNMTPNERGFDTHYGFYQGKQDYYNHTLAGGFDFWDNEKVDFSVTGEYSTLLYSDKLAQLFQQYNSEGRTDPTFVYMSFQTIHVPIETPPDVTDYSSCDGIDSQIRKTYCQQVILGDYVISKIIETYQQYGLWDNTLVALSTDNGGMVATFPNGGGQGTRFSCSSNLPYRGGKATLFEGGVRGVSFISGGGDIIPQKLRGTSSDLFLHVSDWYATLVSMGGGTSPPAIDGMDFWGALTNGEEWNRTTLYINIEELGMKWSGVIHDGYKYFNGQQAVTGWYPAPPLQPIHNSTDVNVTEWLFDIQNDPYEHNNLIDQYPVKALQLSQMIFNAVRSDEYYIQQSLAQHDEGMASNNDGIWTPWLGSPLQMEV